MRLMYVRITPFVPLLAMIFLTSLAHADVMPTIDSLVVDPPSAGNNYPISVSWSTSNAKGVSIYFDCPAGVTLKRDDGSGFPCNSRTNLSERVIGNAGFIATNVSGGTKVVEVTLYPKDFSDKDVETAYRRTSFSLSTSVQPITDLTLSSPTVTSGVPITITWIGVDVPGVNIQFDCPSSVAIHSGSELSSETLPCNALAYSSDKPASGSITVTPENTGGAALTVNVRILPTITAGSYDATHSKSVPFTVTLPESGKAVSSTARITSFNGSAAVIHPGDALDLSWTSENTSGVNIRFQCGTIDVRNSDATSSRPLPCGNFAFEQPLPSNGNITLYASSNNAFGDNLIATIEPRASDGTYLGIEARTLYFVLAAPSIQTPVILDRTLTLAPQGVPATPLLNGTPTPTVAGASTNALVELSKRLSAAAGAAIQESTSKSLFSRPLGRGMENADVTALQTYLAQNVDIYPEGMVTGFFGALTERAVQRFQEKYEIAKAGDEGYGHVGPLTRAKLNSLLEP